MIKLWLLILTSVFTVLLMASCDDMNRRNSAQTHNSDKSDENSSKDVFLRLLPIFSQWDISEVRFLFEQSQQRGVVSSPTDKKTELLGSVEFSSNSWNEIFSGFNWVEVPPDSLPKRLKEYIPESDRYFVSSELNKLFNKNPYLAHGFALVVDFENPIMFLLAHDLNTPIQ